MGLSVWTVKAAVRDALQAALIDNVDPTLADVVCLGMPAEGFPLDKPRRVIVASVTADDPRPMTSPGGQVRREDYIVPVLVDLVSVTGNAADGYATASAATADLVAAIEDCRSSDPSWGQVAFSSGISLVAEDTVPMQNGWHSRAVLSLSIRTRGR